MRRWFGFIAAFALAAGCGGLVTGSSGSGASGSGGASGVGGGSGSSGGGGAQGSGGAGGDEGSGVVGGAGGSGGASGGAAGASGEAGSPPYCTYSTSNTDCGGNAPCWLCGGELYVPCGPGIEGKMCSKPGEGCFACGADGVGEQYVCAGSPRNVWLGQSSMTCSGPSSTLVTDGGPPFCVPSKDCFGEVPAPCWSCGTYLETQCPDPLPSSCTKGGSSCVTCSPAGVAQVYLCAGSPRDLWLAQGPPTTCGM